MQVSSLCLGAMMFGRSATGITTTASRIIHRALDAGINFIDTADVYSAGESEEIVAKALAGGRRDDVILATKCHFPVATGPFDANPQPNASAAAGATSSAPARTACAASAPTGSTSTRCTAPTTRPTSTRRSAPCRDLVHQGKVRAIGSSTFPAELIVEAQWTAERRGRERFRCEQPPYSIFVRSIERDLLPVCQRYGMGVIVWGPLNGGWLSGKYRRESDADTFTTGRAQRMPDRFDPSAARQRPQARPRRGARQAGRRRGHEPPASRAGLDARASGGDVDDRRATHDGAPRRAPRCRRTPTPRRAARPHRRARAAGIRRPLQRGGVPTAMAGRRLSATPASLNTGQLSVAKTLAVPSTPSRTSKKPSVPSS